MMWKIYLHVFLRLLDLASQLFLQGCFYLILLFNEGFGNNKFFWIGEKKFHETFQK